MLIRRKSIEAQANTKAGPNRRRQQLEADASKPRKPKYAPVTLSELEGVRYLHFGTEWVQGAMRIRKPDWIELEITESALMQSLPELIERLGDIARMGVRLALDDFGTGYSSLGYLKRLPLNSLKIDKSFVRDLPGDKEDEAIVCATLSMAKALELKVVAEGVELAEQRAFLADLGCDEIQGWLVARPMPAEAFEAWWRQRQANKTV